MHILPLYEKVKLVLPLEQRRFLNHLNDTLQELKALYFRPDPALLVIMPERQKTRTERENEDEYTDTVQIHTCFYDKLWPWLALSVDEWIPIRELYGVAIVDNILYLAGAGEAYKSEFLRKAENAYQSYRKGKPRNGRIKRLCW